jgi:hypothetical protein
MLQHVQQDQRPHEEHRHDELDEACSVAHVASTSTARARTVHEIVSARAMTKSTLHAHPSIHHTLWRPGEWFGPGQP